MKQTLDRLRIFKSLISLIGDPSKTERVFELADLSRNQRGPLLDFTLEKIAEQDGFMELFRENYSPVIPSLKELAEFPRDSFGYAFARHMIDNGLEVEFFPPVEGSGLEKFILERGRKTHDFWHVLTGYDTSIEGEVGLQGFTLAQTESPFSAVLISGGLLHSVFRAPKTFSPMVAQLFEGYEMGRRAKRLIGLPIETYLEENLEVLKARLSLPLTRHSSRLLHTS